MVGVRVSRPGMLSMEEKERTVFKGVDFEGLTSSISFLTMENSGVIIVVVVVVAPFSFLWYWSAMKESLKGK